MFALSGRNAVRTLEPSRGGTGIRLNIASPRFIEWKIPTKLRSILKKLLKNAKAYKLTNKEIEQTQFALKGYEKELEEYYRNGGA